MRKCKGCKKDISHKHPNARFHSQKCKDNFHNKTNPRGYGVKTRNDENEMDEILNEAESGWDSHKGYY